MAGKICSECGAEVAADAPRGLCPQCRLKAGLASEAVNAPTLAGRDGETCAVVPEQTDQVLVNPSNTRNQDAPISRPLVRYFGDYELLEEIGSGGMGVIYKARQVNLNRLVALKMIRSGKFAGQKEVRRFQVEAEASANLNHQNIVTIYEVGQHEGFHYLAMELVDGCTLTQWVEQNGPLDPNQAALLLAKIAWAVHHAHTQGVLHRDLKPSNILVDKSGEPHVADFGLARRLDTDSSLTLEGDVMGTPSFMAPEQAAGKSRELCAATDVYSLGAILYFLLIGRPPFVAESPLDIMVQVLEGEAIRPRAMRNNIPPDLEGICLHCLEKSLKQRCASAAMLAEDLERFVRGDNVEASTIGFKSHVRRWARRQPALVSHLAGLALCAVIAQVGHSFQDVVPLALHLTVMSLLGVWALLSILCQLCLKRESCAPMVRVIWCGIDVALFTALIWLDDAATGPLLALYPALIAASGLWFRVSLVLFTTGMSMLGYAALMLYERLQHGRIEQLNWHAIVMATLVLTGLVVAYQVHRVRALSRFYEHRPAT